MRATLQAIFIKMAFLAETSTWSERLYFFLELNFIVEVYEPFKTKSLQEENLVDYGLLLPFEHIFIISQQQTEDSFLLAILISLILNFWG